MEFTEVIKRRYSVRSYRSDLVPDDVLAQVLEAARLAPTAANRQPFKIIVIYTEGREAELQRIYPNQWFAQAPLLICVCSVPDEAWKRSDGKNYADIDATIAYGPSGAGGGQRGAGHLLGSGLRLGGRSTGTHYTRRVGACRLHPAGLSP